MTLLATQFPSGVPSWAQVAGIFLLPLVGLGAQYRFWTGWGYGSGLVVMHGKWGKFLARFGFVLMPWTWAAASMALLVLCGRLLYETDLDIFGFLAMTATLTSLACFVWGFKEYRKPSTWRRRPRWLVELEHAKH